MLYHAPLAADAVITGDCSVELFISSDAEDTDFIVRVTEATPDGKSIKLADGVLCAKYREGFEAPRYLQPGAVYPIRIRTTKFSKRFEKGSRLRVTVTSSAKNFLFPNSNTRAGFNRCGDRGRPTTPSITARRTPPPSR